MLFYIDVFHLSFYIFPIASNRDGNNIETVPYIEF